MTELVLMRGKTDCEVAAIGNACEVGYEQALDALDYRRLPKGLENPILGNPWNLYRALICLGFWKRNVTLTDLLRGTAEPGKTIVLVHDPQNPTLAQHWVTWHGKFCESHLLAWGQSQELKRVSSAVLTEYFRKGWPNCAFTVYKANFWRLMLARVQSWFN